MNSDNGKTLSITSRESSARTDKCSNGGKRIRSLSSEFFLKNRRGCKLSPCCIEVSRAFGLQGLTGSDGRSANSSACVAIFLRASEVLSTDCQRAWMKHTSEYCSISTRRSGSLPSAFSNASPYQFVRSGLTSSRKSLQFGSIQIPFPTTTSIGVQRMQKKPFSLRAPV